MTKKMLLVVESDAENRHSLVRYLSAAGCHVASAPTAAQATSIAERDGPSVVVLELRAPLLDSMNLVARVRSRDPATRIIAISCERLGRHMAAEIGADSFMPKPFDPHELLGVIRRLQTRSWFADVRSDRYPGSPRSSASFDDGQSPSVIARMRDAWRAARGRLSWRSVQTGRDGTASTPAQAGDIRGRSPRKAKQETRGHG